MILYFIDDASLFTDVIWNPKTYEKFIEYSRRIFKTFKNMSPF